MINDFVFVTPESAGLASEKIHEMLDYLEEWKINVHSFLIARGGNIIAEAYAPPFDEHFKHRLYSCTKTFVAIAVGKLVGEGKVRLDDKLYTFFSEYTNGKNLNEWVKDITVKDALTMSVPFIPDGYINAGKGFTKFKTKDWARSFFSGEFPSEKPNGMLFSYNTSATYELNVLVEKLTGKTFLEYIQPELEKIGIEDIECVQSPDGYSWGGSGILCKMRDFAKFGELLMHKGEHKGKQLFPRKYMEEAISKQTDTLMDGGYGVDIGYGYQIWVHKYGFALHGMAGQFIFCFPDKDFMFVCNSDTLNVRDGYKDKFYHCALSLYHALQENALTENEKEYFRLQARLKAFSLPLGFGEKTSPLQNKIDGATYKLSDNAMKITRVRFSWAGERGVLYYENERGKKEIPFGMEYYEIFDFPETHYYDKRVATPANRSLRALSSASWLSENRLLIRINIADTNMGHLGIIAEFKGDLVALKFTKTAEELLWEYNGYAVGKKIN